MNIKDEVRFIKRLALILSVLVSLGFIVGSQHAIDQLGKRLLVAERPQNFFETARDRVFRVYISSMFGIGGGTASLIRIEGQGTYVLTNKHICEAFEGSPGAMMTLEQGGKRYFTKPVKKSKKTDLCILLTPPFLETEPAYVLSKKRLLRDDPVYVFGHPYLESLTESHGQFKYELVLPKIENEKYDLSGLNAGRLSFFIRPGNSGSPVLNEDGEVVGVVFAVDDLGGLFIPLSSV